MVIVVKGFQIERILISHFPLPSEEDLSRDAQEVRLEMQKALHQSHNKRLTKIPQYADTKCNLNVFFVKTT